MESRVWTYHSERDERERVRSWMLMDLPPTGGCVNEDLQKGHLTAFTQIDDL